MNGSGRGIVLYPAGGGAPRVVAQPDERTHPVRVGREQDAGIAFFPPGGGYAPEVIDAIDRAVKKLQQRIDSLDPVETKPEPDTVNKLKTRLGSVAATLNQLIESK